MEHRNLEHVNRVRGGGHLRHHLLNLVPGRRRNCSLGFHRGPQQGMDVGMSEHGHVVETFIQSYSKACAQAGQVGWVEESVEHNGQVTARLNC